MEVETEEASKTVLCLFTDPEGAPLRTPMFLPQNAGPPQLQQIVNTLLHNVTFIHVFCKKVLNFTIVLLKVSVFSNFICLFVKPMFCYLLSFQSFGCYIIDTSDDN